MASYSNTRVKTMDSVNEDTANYAQDIAVNGGMTTAFWQNQNEEWDTRNYVQWKWLNKRFVEKFEEQVCFKLWLVHTHAPPSPRPTHARTHREREREGGSLCIIWECLVER